MPSSEAQTSAPMRHGDRYASPANKFKLTSIDHVGLACRDPDVSGRFVEDVLGGIELFRAGYDELDRKLGRLRHIFYHVGTTLVEVVENEDKKSYADPASKNTNPHWAFGATPENLAAFVKHLDREGIPYDGPRSHTGVSAVSVYFRDPDGNNLEVTTWSPIPAGLMPLKPMGGPYGFIEWDQLSHDWRPKS